LMKTIVAIAPNPCKARKAHYTRSLQPKQA